MLSKNIIFDPIANDIIIESAPNSNDRNSKKSISIEYCLVIITVDDNIIENELIINVNNSKTSISSNSLLISTFL